MNTIFAGLRPASRPAELARVEALLELQHMTGVKTDVWVGEPDESMDEQTERLEFLADVMLGIDENDKPAAARVAELHRQVLGEPAHGSALRFRHGHGDPVDWSRADFEAYDHIARAEQLDAEPAPWMFVGKARSGKGSGYAAAVRELVAEVRAA